ncbi:MAG: Na+/H+ antiporter NhaA [Myxococcota bacterium]
MRAFHRFMDWEPSGGMMLLVAAAAALIVVNSQHQSWYHDLFDTPLIVQMGTFKLAKPFILWVNDGLMTIFFLMVGLEIKRELIEGELNSFSKMALPAIAALGGMVVPAAFYALLNWNDPLAMRGWATPVATDIAFSLGVLSLVGSRVPLTLKVFLTALATFDDLGAIVVIAVRYTDKLSHDSLLLALCSIFLLITLNRSAVRSLMAYGVVGLILWVCVLKSGVHATLAGVIMAFAIPLRDPLHPEHSPLRWLEEALWPWVTFAVLPLFAFANAGIPLEGMNLQQMMSPVVIGCAGGLFFGKQVGIFGATWLGVKLKLAPMPSNTNWLGIYGMSLVCGVGFTMSFFIGALAFNSVGSPYTEWVRLGVIWGSLLSAAVGYCILRYGPVTTNSSDAESNA